MYGTPFTNTKHAALDSIREVMAETNRKLQAAKALCEEFGISKKEDLPFEEQARFDALLEQKLKS